MSELRPSGSPAPNALARLGALREVVAAATNLNGLLTSREVGPKLLAPLIPEVAGSLSHWKENIDRLTDFITAELQLETEELIEFSTHSASAPSSLRLALEEASRRPVHARQRLALEGLLKSALPKMFSSLSLLELLVEVTCAPAVPTIVGEIISPAPETINKAPHRPVALIGSADGLRILAPARIVLLCLGALAGTFPIDAGKSLGLKISGASGYASFSFASTDRAGPILRLPIFRSSRHTLPAVRAALRPYSGNLVEAPLKLQLPLQLVGNTQE